MAKKLTKTGKFGKLGTVPLMYVQVPGYKVIKKIGRGGMSIVYLSRNDETNKQVALKLIVPGKEIDEYTKTVFVREIEHLKVLQHPNIVKIENSGYTGKKLFLALEYCDCGTLRDWLQREQAPLSPPEAVAVALQVLDALEYAHQVKVPDVELETGDTVEAIGLVHRDIKPANIFLCQGEEIGEYIVKVGDFGLSKAFNSSGLSGKTLTGTLGGTPGFIPRQQLINYKYVKPEVDIWAVAACIYYMLTLKTPRDFDSRNSYETLMKHEPVPIRDRNYSIPEELAGLLDEALRDDRDLRFKYVGEFRDALLEATAHYSSE